MQDLLPALSPKARPDWDSMQAEEMLAAIATSGHCSALIQVTGDLSQLLFAHSSWFVYASMLRTYKHYSFAHRSMFTAAQVKPRPALVRGTSRARIRSAPQSY